jgi:uncharacterized integral membrane protein
VAAIFRGGDYCARDGALIGAEVGVQEPAQSVPARPVRKVSPEVVVAALLAVVLLIFVVQNDERIDVSWVVFTRRAPLWMVILISALLGYLIGQLIEFGVKRRIRRQSPD